MWSFFFLLSVRIMLMVFCVKLIKQIYPHFSWHQTFLLHFVDVFVCLIIIHSFAGSLKTENAMKAEKFWKINNKKFHNLK